MTRDEMIEKLAKLVASEDDEESDDLYFRPALVEANEARWKRIAAAVLDLVGPRPLVWHQVHNSRWECEYYFIEMYTWPDLPTQYRLHRKDETWYGEVISNRSNLEAAQEDAKTHHEAAHWANTKMGDA